MMNPADPAFARPRVWARGLVLLLLAQACSLDTRDVVQGSIAVNEAGASSDPGPGGATQPAPASPVDGEAAPGAGASLNMAAVAGTALCGTDEGCQCNEDVQSCEPLPLCDGGVDCDAGLACTGCLVAGECVAAESVNPLNPCQWCDPSSDPSGWSNVDGSSCDDRTFCTVDDVCTNGACVGSARVCDDGVACNGVSTCDENAQACTPGLTTCEAGFVCDTTSATCVSTCNGCSVAGTCHAPGEADPGNPCRICDPAQSRTAFSAAVGRTCGAAAGLCSAQDTCDAQGQCQPNHLAEGTACGNPNGSACDAPDSCDGRGSCLPRVVANSTPCDDGRFCTVGDACQGGVCTPSGTRNCGAGLTCNENVDQCQCQGCVVGGNCFAPGALNGNNNCQICDPARSTTAFSGNTGANCGSAATECSAQDTCNAQGQCQPNHFAEGRACGNPASGACDGPDTCDGSGNCSPRVVANTTPCNDGRFCTIGDACQGGVCTATGNRNCGVGQSCDETADTCRCQGCVIGGTCVASGTVNASNPCQICDPLRSAAGFSPNGGANCGSPASVCSAQDTCSNQGVCQRNDFNAQTSCGNPDACGVRDQCDGAGNCQDRSSDLNSDPANCGACGHNCEGGACTSGVCQPFALVSGRSNPRGVVVDATNVYWMEGTSVNRFPRSPRSGATTVAAASNQAGLNSLRRSNAQNRLFWATGSQITSANADGSNPTGLVTNRANPVSGLFLNPNDNNQETLFWAEQNGDAQTYFIRLATGNNPAIQTPGGDTANPIFWGGSGSCGFYTDELFGPTQLWRICLNTFEIPYQGPGVVQGFHADSGSLYVGAAGQGLVRLNLANPTNPTILASSSGTMGDIETDLTSIYFVDGSSAGNGCSTSGFVSRIPKTGGGGTAALPCPRVRRSARRRRQRHLLGGSGDGSNREGHQAVSGASPKVERSARA